MRERIVASSRLTVPMKYLVGFLSLAIGAGSLVQIVTQPGGLRPQALFAALKIVMVLSYVVVFSRKLVWAEVGNEELFVSTLNKRVAVPFDNVRRIFGSKPGWLNTGLCVVIFEEPTSFGRFVVILTPWRIGPFEWDPGILRLRELALGLKYAPSEVGFFSALPRWWFSEQRDSVGGSSTPSRTPPPDIWDG